MNSFFERIRQTNPDEVSFIYPSWIKEIRKTHRSAPEIAVLLAEMVNQFWIKDETNYPVGIKETWRSYIFVGNLNVLQKWCDRLHFSLPMVRDYLNGLVVAGFVEELPLFTGEETKAIICSKTPQQIATYLTYQCEWCSCFTGYLHNHHYPIPRSQGGEETVAICPNCHCEFHQLIRLHRYKITQKVWDVAIQEREVEHEN